MCRIVCLLGFLAMSFGCAAQNVSAVGVQQVQLNLYNAIELSWINNKPINLSFKNTTDFEKGVTSDPQQLRVCSQQKFDITIKAAATHFSYNGASTLKPLMPVNGVLSIRVVQNTTCGIVAAPFSLHNYHSINNNEAGLLINAESCSAENIGVVYHAAPGFSYPPGTYIVDVIYTATQQ